MYKAIMFCRVSSNQQDYQRQITDLTPLILGDGYDMANVYIIKHKESATKNNVQNRKSIQELKDVISNNNIETVYVTEASRLARRGDVFYSVLALLEENKICLTIQTPTLLRTYENGKPNAIAHIVISFLAQVAAAEAEQKLERQISGVRQKRKEGKITSGTPVFGYERDKNNKAIPNENAQIVKNIFDMYIEGASTASIYEHYKYAGIFHKGAKERSRWMYISRILRDKTYIGQNKNFQYPPIIDEETFNKAQVILDSRVRPKTHLSNIYYCQSLIKLNGYTLVPDIAKVNYKYYDSEKREASTININIIDSLVWNLAAVAKAMMNQTADEARQKQAEEQLELIKKSLNGINDDIKANEDEQERITYLFAKGRIGENKYEYLATKAEEELAHILKEKEQLNINKIQLENILTKATTVDQATKDYNAIIDITDDKMRQQIVKETINEIRLLKVEDGFHIVIDYVDKSLNNDTFYYYKRVGRARSLKNYLYEMVGDVVTNDLTGTHQVRFVRKK